MVNNMNKINWLHGYEGHYAATPEGDIVSYKYGRPVIMKTKISNSGYLFVRLCMNAKYQWKHTHRLIAEVYLSTWDSILQVNHIDGDKLNNNISNLEMCTAKENGDHARKLGLWDCYGENCNLAKLTWIEVNEMRRLFKAGKSQTDLSKIYNVTYTQINRIINNQRWVI